MIMEQDFKVITIENWNKADEVSELFNKTDVTEYVNLERILNIRLDNCVPVEVRRMFEIARGVIVYGYYFYPLYTLGMEQLHRVGESAVKHKLKSIEEVKGKVSFTRCVERLKELKVVEGKSYNRWKTLKEMRNASSHATRHSLLPIEMVINHMAVFAKEVNKLFQ